MKTLSQILFVFLSFVKWVLILLVLIFALATFMGGSYLQTLILLIAVLAMIWWPGVLKKKWGKGASLTARFVIVLAFLISGFVLFPPETKTSIYLNEEIETELIRHYDKQLTNWPEGTEELFIDTQYGKVHVLAYGADSLQPIIMMHAASMGAHSWAENLEPLMTNYRVYAIDNIGEGNKSKLNDALVFPENGKEIADFYALIADSLGVISSPVFGASNGGFIALNYAYYYPERVEALALFGPMGLTQLSGQSYMMMTIPIMYPFQFVRDYVKSWAIGNDPYVIEQYGEWFDCILKGSMPSVAAPVPMTTKQKQEMNMPVLLFLGTKDPLVGDAEYAKHQAEEFPDIDIMVLESGHLIAVEKSEQVNKALTEFLNSNIK